MNTANPNPTDRAPPKGANRLKGADPPTAAS